MAALEISSEPGADTVAIHASGGITASAPGSLLISKAAKGAQAQLKGTLAGGKVIDGLH